VKKCRLAKSTRERWIKVINKALRQKEYGCTDTCALCKEINRKEGGFCDKCIIMKFYIAKNHTSYPGLPCVLLVGSFKVGPTRKFLREIKAWLKN
jgi:hypothetical protein